jgi:hypothetical protein
MAVSGSGKDKLLRHARIYIGGYDLSGDARTVSSLDSRFGEVDITGWSEFVKNFLPDWHLQAGVRGFQALLNDTAGRAFNRLKDAENSSQLSFCFGGGGEPAVPDPAYHLPSIQLGDMAGCDGKAAAIGPMDFLPDAGQFSTNFQKVLGFVLRGPTSLSGNLTASSATSVDFGAASSAGYTAIIHVLSTSSGNFAMTVKHSTDDSSFSTLGTFTTTGGSIGSELLTGSGSVNRYVAFDAQRTAGTITVIVTFVRN